MKQLFTSRILGLLAMSLIITASAFADTFQGHEYVDLGLPSGLRWATCNLGASSPQDYGNYYAWGELETKSNYSNSTYNPHNSNWGRIDNDYTLLPSCDAVWTQWGGSWRMPTNEEFEELCKKCSWSWKDTGNTEYAGVAGFKVTGPNGKSIFLPAAGEIVDALHKHTATYGNYWTSTSVDDICKYCFFAKGSKGAVFTAANTDILTYGQSIRPVYMPVSEITICSVGRDEYGDYVYFPAPESRMWRLVPQVRHQQAFHYALVDMATGRVLKHEAYHEEPHYGDHAEVYGPYDSYLLYEAPCHTYITTCADANGNHDEMEIIVLAPDEDRGSCGKNLRYSIDVVDAWWYETYALSITGSGEMGSWVSDYPTEEYYNTSAPRIVSISIDNGVTSLSDGAFSLNVFAETITIPSSVERMGEKLFGDYYNNCWWTTREYVPLKTLYVGPVPAQIQESTFDAVDKSRCTLYVPSGTKKTYQNAPGWKEFQNIVELGNTITYTSSDGQVINPNNVNAFGANIVSNEYSNGKGLITFDGNVTRIGYRSFSNCSSLTSIDIPSSVQMIDMYAFAGCSSLTSIVIPSSVNTIHYGAFEDCSSLTSMFVTENVPIPNCHGQESVFYGITETCTLYVPQGYKQEYQADYFWGQFTNIVEGPFNVIYYTTSDGQIVNPRGPRKINANVVSNVYENGLGTITFDGPVTDLGMCSFQNSNLTSIIIPPCAERIGQQVFNNCSSLSSITIPESVRRIDDFAFDGCHSLTSINIPAKVTNIGGDVFAHCWSLSSITVDSDNTTYDSRNNCNAIIETASNTLIAGCYNTVIPESVTSIGRGAFQGSSLASIKIPTSVTSIEGFAFVGCSNLKTITIPSSVTKIGAVVFRNCSNLRTIYVSKNVADASNFAFDEITSTCTLMVPKGYKSIYQNAPKWSSFSNIQEYGDIAIVGCNDLLPSELRLDWGTRHQTGRWAEAIDASTGEVLEDVVWSSNRCVYLATDSYYGWQNLNSPQQFIEAQYPGLATINVLTTDGLDRTASVNIRILADFDASGWIGDNLFYERKYIEDPFNSYQLAGPYSLTITGSGDMYTSNDNPYDYQPQYWYDENAISLPEGLTSISSGFFMLQPRITTINLPSTIERIDQFAFYGSGLKTITLPASVKQIGDEAFGSTSLQTVICEALTPPSISQYTFYDVSSCTLKVPYASLNAYYNDPYWGRFGEITSIEGYARVCYFPAGYPSCMVTGEVQSGLYAATENGTSVTLWSSNPEVVTINNGVLTGIAPGTATIYAMANDPGQASNSFTLVVYLDGDANGNGKVTIADATTTVSHILDGSNTPASFVWHAANVNRSDYDINVADVSGIVNIAMNNMEYNAPQRAKGLGESDEAVRLRAMPFSIEQGKTTTVPIIVENPTVSFSAFEFTMHLPSGIRVKLDEDGNAMASLSTDRIIDGDQYSFSSRYSEDDNALHVICFSSGNVPFEGHDGIVANVTFEADNLMTTGEYVLTVGETILSDHGEIIRAADESVTFSVGNGQVGISTIGDDTTHTLMIYDLEGRLIKIGGTIDELPAGCYIVNGEKVIK